MRVRPTRLRESELRRALLLRGPLWTGDGTEHADGRVVIDAAGVVISAGAGPDVATPSGADEIDAAWVGPGLVDAHVHLAFGEPSAVVAAGVVAVRDLGAPPADAARWRKLAAPRVEIAGPLLTAPGGYPSRSWGRNGFAAFVDDPEQATRLVSGLCGQVDVVKLAFEAGGGPVPDPATARAVVATAHANGRLVTAHALTRSMVERALDAGVDELAHTPIEPLPEELVARIAERAMTVVSTLHTFGAGTDGRSARANAAALLAADVSLRYGTDLGNAGTKPGADPVEMAVLADDVGLGADGALRAATVPIRVGAPAGIVGLDADPRTDPRVWRHPVAVVVGSTLLRRE